MQIVPIPLHKQEPRSSAFLTLSNRDLQGEWVGSLRLSLRLSARTFDVCHTTDVIFRDPHAVAAVQQIIIISPQRYDSTEFGRSPAAPRTPQSFRSKRQRIVTRDRLTLSVLPA